MFSEAFSVSFNHTEPFEKSSETYKYLGFDMLISNLIKSVKPNIKIKSLSGRPIILYTTL